MNLTASLHRLPLQAQRWLRLSDASQALQDDTSLPEDFDKPRPLGLGLGAKVKPEQHKVPVARLLSSTVQAQKRQLDGIVC